MKAVMLHYGESFGSCPLELFMFFHSQYFLFLFWNNFAYSLDFGFGFCVGRQSERCDWSKVTQFYRPLIFFVVWSHEGNRFIKFNLFNFLVNFQTDNRRMGVLHAMRMAPNIGNGSQNRSDNGHIASDISAGCVACAISVEHRTIPIAERL